MVVAVQTGEPITAIIPARPSSSSSRNGSHGRPADEPVLEIKQKSSSRHEKRTKRDYYRHSGDGKQPPIEYVYTYSEETPKPGSSSDPNGARNSNGTLTDLVPVNGNGPSGKIECTLGEDGNLVVKIRGKPDSVPLDPSNLPIKLPDGWQLKEIQTNQRSRKTERSRKTRIKDEVLVEDEANENAVVVYNEHTLPVNGEMGVHETDQEQFGHADEEEYVHGERDGVTFVQKKSKKYEQGPAGLTSRIEESRSEEGIDFDHPNNKQRSSRNLHSLMERTENAKRKFSKQSVTDEKVTEKHTSNVMYFDGNSSSAGGPAENLRDDRRQTSARNEYSSRSDVRGRGDHHQQHNHDIIVESPDDTPYNSLDRRHHRHQQHQEEIVNVDDRYRYHNGDRVGDAAANYDSSNYSTLDRSQRRHETDVTETDCELYREDLFGPGGTHRYHPPRQERTDHTTEREVLREDIYGPGGKSRYPEPPSSYGDERSERVSERELYREDIYGPDGKRRLPGTGSVTDRTDQTTERELLREDIFGPDGKRRSPRGRDLDERSEQTIEKELYREDIYDPDGRRLPGTGSVNERTDQTTEREFSREDLYGPDGKRRSPRGRDLDDRSEQTTERELFREDIYGPNGGRRIPERSGLNERTDQTVEKNVYRESIYGPSPLPGTNFRPSSLIPTVRDDSLYQRSDTRNSNLTDLTDIRNANSRQGNYNDTNVETSTTQRTDITEKYRNGVEVASRPIQNAHRQETFSENLERTSVAGSYPRHPHLGSRDTVVENTERTDTAEHFVVQPGASHQQPLARPSDSRQTEKSENVTITEHRRNKSPPGTLYTEVEFLNDHKPREQVTERSERTDVSEIYHSEVPVKGRQPSGQNPKSSSYSELRRVDRAEDLRETSSLIDHRTDIRENFEGPIKASQPTSSTNRIDNTERVEEFRSSQTFQSGQSGPVQPARGTDADTERSTKRTDATSMVTTSEITVNGVKSPSPPPLGQTEQRVKGNKERVTIDDRYRVVGRSDEQQQPRPQTFYSGTDQQTTGQSNVKTEEAYRRQTDSVRDSNYNQHVVTEKEKQHRSHSRLTEASSTGERIVPIGGSGVVPESLIPPFSRQSSRLSSVDLSEIKAADHLDNQVLKDRGNLAQNGSMGQRRPPTRNPVKYHFGDENGPDDVLSNSDTTLPTHFGGAPFRPTVTAPRGQSVASSDLYVDRGAYDRTNKSTVTQQQSQQRTMRDDRVLINYTDTSTKPDWVSNIDQHFSGQRNVHHNIHYARENVTSPTPRIEEIVTIPGSTVITVNGEHEPVHGIVTEPGDRPLLPVAHPIERDVVHQSEKGSKYGFTRVTESKGFKQSAKEKVQYQERQENTRQISVSYSVPGRGKETREYTWDGIHEQPEEKITFQEDREHRKDVSLTLGLDSLQPRLPQRPTSTTTERTQTTDLKEKIVFAETREPQQREVSVNLSLQTDRQKQEISARHPIESNTFHFEEAVNRERSVNLVVGLDQDQQRLENIHERKETHRSARHEHKELYDVRTQEVQDIEYYEPIPKVTFQEEREVKKDVSFTLGLEDYEAAQPFEPIPVEKITFEETREIVTDHDVAVVFGLDTPAPVYVQSPRPVSVMSESTIKTRDTIQTREIVPQVTKVREEIKKVETIEQIIQESRVDTRVVVTPPPPPSPPSGVVIARTEIIPPLPRKTSISAAIESAAIHHNEVDLAKPSDSTRIFETSVEKEAKEHRERAEQKIQVQPPPPIPLPPTSGRVEKHVHLENLIPEPTGEHLPESLLTTGFVYTATLEPKRPDLDQTIDFHVHPPAVPETVERVETLQWYVKEGKPPSEIPDDESITTVGELRSATPPYHGELTATAQITPPTRVTATTEITPPVQKPKVVKESPTVRAEVSVVPPPPPQKPKPRPKEPVIEPLIPAPSKQFYFGEDEEDRLSVHSGHSWEEVVPQTPRVVPPPVKPARAVPEPPVSRVNQLSRRPGAEAQPTHHSELQFATREEEELWKTSLERHALPSRKRTEQSLQLERTEEPHRPVPKPSGRIPKKTWSEKIDTENTSQRGAKVLGTYGFLYTATLNPQATVRGKPLDVDEWQMATTSSFTSVDLDVQQVLLSAFTDIEPALTPKQQHQLMIASMEIFPPLSEVQQQLLLDALVVINLTVDQQRQLLTGCEIIPPLTHRQQQQLMTASAEIIPGFTPKQEKRLFYASLQVDPPLTPDQQQQLLFAVSEIFPPSSGPRTRRRTLKEIEEMTRSVEEEEDEMETVYKYGRKRPEETVGRINRRGEWERTTVESESRESAAVDIINRRKEEYEQATRKDERWREDTTRTDEHWREGISTSHNRPQQQHRSERHVGHGNYHRDKEVSLNQRKWLAEQSTYLEDEDQDLEVSAINMNVKPRIKSEILMAPSPPARSMSPAVRAGSRYTASPQMGTPPMTTEFSGFMYEAPVDGHGSPMSAEMGTYGFTYQATLDGSEPYRKQAEAHMGELEIYTESRKREEYSETPKTITNTPPRRSPWSTPPVTPTPVLATATPPPRGTTPLPPVKELVESRDSAWRKHEETSWGRSLYEKDIVGGRKEFPSLEVTLPVGATHRQEVRGRLDSPEEEVTERITENVIRRRTEQELTYEEQEMNRIAAEASSWLKRTDNKQVEHTGRNTTDPVNRGRPTQSDPRRDPVSHQQQETWETKSTSSFSTRQERVEHESRQGLGDRGPPSDVVHPPNTPFKCDYPLVEPPRPSRDRSRDRASSRDSSREDLERKTAEVIKRAEEMESLYEASTSSSTTNQQSTTNSAWTEKDPQKPRTERPRDSSVDRTKFDRSLEALDRKTTSVVNRVQEMAVAYGTNQNELTTTTTQQQHGPGWSGTRDPAVRDSDVLKRVHEMESEQKTSAAIKRQKDLEAEEQARREREEVERKTASVVKRVKEMEDEQQRIRRLKEQEFSSRQVPESAPEPERRLGMGPDRVIETTMRRTQHREVHFEDQITATVDPTGSNPPESESQPDWIRLVEERKRRQEPLQQYFRPEKYAKKDTPRQLAELPEEDPLDAALERIGERKRQAMKGSPDGSPSSLRKWGNVGALSASASPLPTTSKDDSSFNKGFRRHTTETKEVIEESRFHSEEAMLEALESGDSNLISTMSQSLPSLALMKLMENTPSGQLDRALKDAVSMEELRKTSTKVKRTDGAEEEVREESFARRGDTVSPETKRTKRTVVRKLDKNGEWKEVAVREEDIPMDGDLLGPPVDLPIERVIAGMKSPEDDEWSLSDAVIEETTTTRTIRRVEEEEEDIISIAGTDA